MPYNGPVYHAHEQDRRGDFYMRGAEGFTQGVTSGLEAVAGKMEEAKKARTERDFLAQQMEVMMPKLQQMPDGPEMLAKFQSGSLGAQRGIFTGLQARLAEQEKAAMQQREDNRWNMKFNLDSAQAANAANYQQAQVENMNADNTRQTALMNWQMQPDNQTPLYEQLPDGTTAVGVKGSKSGTHFYNFLPPKAATPYDTKPLTGARITSYGYSNDPTPDSNSRAGIGAFVPDVEQAKIKAGQASPYRLRDGDIAVSPDIEAQFRKAGINPGDELVLHGEGGASRRVRWMDRTSPKLQGRVDFYSPNGAPGDDGGAVTGFGLLAKGAQTAAKGAQTRVQTATVKMPDGSEQTVERTPDGGWRPVQVQDAPPMLDAGGAGKAPAGASSALDAMRAKFGLK